MRTRALLAALAAILALATATPATAGQEHATRIVWTQVLDDEFTTARIVSAYPDGSGFRALTHPAAGEFDIDAVISPDGSRVAVERDLADGSAQIIIVGADGRGEHVVDLGCVDPCALDAAPGWTPDGRRITFTPVIGPFDQVNDSARSAVLHTANLDGSGVRRLSEPGIDGAFEDYRARFAPGGKYLIFVRVRNRDIKAAVFRMRPDGTHVRRLTPWRLDADLPDVSTATHGPTKDLVVFETFGHGPPEGSQQDIATVPATCFPLADCTSKIRYVTNNGAGPATSFNPAWSPNGRRIAFTNVLPPPGPDSPPIADIWTVRPNGKDRQRVSHSPRFEFRPDWGVAA
jgi:Tol biopolymer transport system component